MYAMLLPSANDAANALAEHVSGSIESFSTVMNTKARELGCTNTNFTNPSGLQEEEHYTTVRDLSLIAKEAFSNTTISKIVSTTNYTLLKTNKYEKNDRKFTTTNYMVRKDLRKYYCDYCVGGKTGYTGEAKNCVIEYANKDGIQLIAIVMGENSKIKGQKFIEAKKLFDYIYQNYENKNIANSKDIYEKIKIANGTKETRNLEVSFKDNIQILERKDVNIEDLEKQIEYTNKKAPIQMQIVTACQKRKSFLPARMVTSLDIEALFFKAVRILIIQMRLWFLSWRRSENATLIVPSHFLLENVPKKVIKNYMMQELIVICFDMKLLTQSFTRNSTQKVFL